MGSKSDWETMRHAVETLQELGVPHEVRVVSAHRTPDQMFAYAETAAERGIEVIIAGAGGAAHLPGMTAAKTSRPVLGVPVQSRALSQGTAQIMPDAPLELHARDKTTGEILASVPLPAPGQYGMMTYMHEGKQYIVVQSGSVHMDFPGSLVALTLP